FPGNLQGRSVRECGPKGAVLVDVADGRVEGLRLVHVEKARWLHETVDLSGAGDEREALHRIREALGAPLAAAAGRPVVLRVTLAGRTAAHHRLKADAAQLRAEVQALADQCREDVWLETVKVATAPVEASPAPGASELPDAATLFGNADADPAMKALAGELLAQVMAKIPPSADGREALEAEIDAILADARSLALARAEAAGER
ncbi:hypothetical protein WDZ92_33080, partial [Nostoc sp. NIES-2111]